MGGYWIDGGDDGEGGKRPDAWIPSGGGGGGSEKKGGCDFAIPRVVWTIIKVTFNYVIRGKKPDYVI